ncbi:NADP-dependent phosphogluconate dehydrogenase [Ferruginibacter albus]|uniref:NADP-dependent phosphogluconate dehydrogenase n=1 Tax=Ferruginibacter albus TaxID=2875540 RepID=UPI001CC50A00|nr:NADP-dependent phosphogluconate dehydrogenase [Ferruginibacter albus]UAY52211.1 NADP-dependent phosphogluconate dehydrogenase [Ferruginibacter albus]
MQQYDFGMIGLGTMGRNLLLNISDHGFSVAGFDKSTAQVDALKKEGEGRQIFSTAVLKEFIDSLKQPKVIMLLVPAGKIVDSVIADVKPFLSKDDLLIDLGNSHFTDTNRRNEELAKENIHFMGAGVSGGESGARFGPSIMPGGNKDAYNRIAEMLKAVAAKVNGEACVTYVGSGSAGHYVKMVHNGIEYGIMQLIAEAYHLLKDVLQLNNDELHTVFANWNKGILQSFLIEITADIFLQQDDLTKNRLVDMILDAAQQKGTGAWTSEDAMNLQVPIPAIDTAVSMRDLSAYKKERILAQQILTGPAVEKADKKEFIDVLEQALYFSMITTYAQGLSLLYTASEKYQYGLNLQEVAAIWRGGCIIRSGLLEDFRAAFTKDPALTNILLDKGIAEKLIQSQNGLRTTLVKGISSGIPLPVMSASLAYYDSYRNSQLPSNLLQAQRDYFGAHTYQRIDREGIFHTHWNQKTN